VTAVQSVSNLDNRKLIHFEQACNPIVCLIGSHGRPAEVAVNISLGS
jgi:hypothetical protein